MILYFIDSFMITEITLSNHRWFYYRHFLLQPQRNLKQEGKEVHYLSKDCTSVLCHLQKGLVIAFILLCIFYDKPSMHLYSYMVAEGTLALQIFSYA